MRRIAPLLLLCVMGLSAACATVRSRAEDAFTRGDYLAAAGLYDEVVREHPKDAEARDRLATSRARALEGQLVTAEARIRANDAEGGLKATATLLDTRETWAMPASERITRVAAWAQATLRDEILRTRDRDGVFAAEARLRARASMLRHPELASSARELEGIVASAGDANCAALKSYISPQLPYLTELVASYCRHFHAPVPAPSPLPDLVSRIDVGGAVEGLDAAQRAALVTAADGWLHDSIWYAPEPARVGHMQISGTIRSTFGATAVSRSVDWMERVSYLATEMYQEPYQQSYLDTEYYSEQEPYSDTETYYTTCGYGSSSHSCSQTRTVTKYRSVQKSRLVTKWRTAYRSAMRTVTRYRDEPRVFTYDAIERVGAYRADWSAQIAFGAAEPFIVHRVNATQGRGDDHDVEFENAGVHPSRANLMTHAGWVDTQVTDLGKGFAAATDAHWIHLYCDGAAFTDEEAARCVYLRQPSYAPAARTQLAHIFGRELDPLLAVAP